MSNFYFRKKEKHPKNQILNPICRFEYITLERFKTINNQINGSRKSKDHLLEAAKIGVYIETLKQILSEFGIQYQKNEENGQYTIFDKNKNKEKRCIIHDALDNVQKYNEPVTVPLEEFLNDGNELQETGNFAEINETEMLTNIYQYNMEREEAQKEKYKGGKNQKTEEFIEEEVELCNGYAIGFDYL